ncbi:MAG: hypothetical protein HWE16_08820, partial [Gammaproteobacteria bacterium]|nr:hypothetical protein [Gammaproteobacteria bacterium]
MNTNSMSVQLIITIILSTVAIWLFAYFLEIRLVNAMIATHVVLGSLAFLVGAFSSVSKKGGKLHKSSGRLFYLFMTVSAIYTLIVATMPNHFSTSMFQISIMTLYFLIGGIRSLSYKKSDHQYMIDKLLVYLTILVSIFILFYAKYLYGGFQPLQTVFGILAINFCILDLWIFSKAGLAKKRWLALHLSKMLAGYTTAVTGFFVAQK